MKSSASENNLVNGVSISSASIRLTLIDGRVVHVPLSLYPTLHDASDAQRRDFKVMGDGEAIHWPQLDLDLTVEGMVRGWGEAIPAPPPLPDWARAAKDLNVFPIQDGGWGVSTGIKMKNIVRYPTKVRALREARELAGVVGVKRIKLLNRQGKIESRIDLTGTRIGSTTTARRTATKRHAKFRKDSHR